MTEIERKFIRSAQPNRKVAIKPDKRRPPFCITADQQTRRRFCRSLDAQVTHTEFQTPPRRQLWFIWELSEQLMRSLQFICSLFSWTWLMCERSQFNIPAVGIFCTPDVTFLCKRMFLAASLGLPLSAWRGPNKIITFLFVWMWTGHSGFVLVFSGFVTLDFQLRQNDRNSSEYKKLQL